jgi:hypothetical protein
MGLKLFNLCDPVADQIDPSLAAERLIECPADGEYNGRPERLAQRLSHIPRALRGLKLSSAAFPCEAVGISGLPTYYFISSHHISKTK